MLADVSGEILEDIIPQDEKRFQNHQCCLRGLSKSETDKIQAMRKRVLSAVASAMDPSLRTNAKRRKRQGTQFIQSFLEKQIFTQVKGVLLM